MSRERLKGRIIRIKDEPQLDKFLAPILRKFFDDLAVSNKHFSLKIQDMRTGAANSLAAFLNSRVDELVTFLEQGEAKDIPSERPNMTPSQIRRSGAASITTDGVGNIITTPRNA